MSLTKRFIILFNFMLVVPPGIPCIYQVVIAFSWVFLSFLSFMPAPWLWVISHIARVCLMSNQAKPFYISFPPWSSPLLGGDLPPSFIILHMFPCIEHRYVPLLGASLTIPHTHLLLAMYYKALLFFFKISKYVKSWKRIKVLYST